MFRNDAVSSSPFYKCEEDAVLIESEQIGLTNSERYPYVYI